MDNELFGADYWDACEAKKPAVANQIQHAQGIANSYPPLRPWCHDCGSYECDH